MGSALVALTLAGFTPAGGLLPRDGGYTVAFLVLGAVSLLGGLLSLVLRQGRASASPVPVGARGAVLPVGGGGARTPPPDRRRPRDPRRPGRGRGGAAP